MGANIRYIYNSVIHCSVIDTTKNQSTDLIFSLFVMLFAFLSGFILYHLALGSIAEDYFKDYIEENSELPAETTFKNIRPDIEERIGESYYINYFVKKISRIFKIRPKTSLDRKYNLVVDYLGTIPYVDVLALQKKLKLFNKWKKKVEYGEDSLSKKVLKVGFEFFMETLANIFTMANVVYASLLGYIAFFFYFKNENPSLFSFLPFVGIFLLGIKTFKTFIFYSQFLIGIPLILNFMLFYFSNLELDIANCKNSSWFYCQKWFGYIRKIDDANFSQSTLLKETLVKIVLFQGIFFFYRMLKFTDELFAEKSHQEMSLEIDQSFNRDNLPFIKILIIQITSKFYIICLLLMLYIGTSDPSYTNMVLLVISVVFLSKIKLVKKKWIFIYIVMNLIFITAYLIDLLMNSSKTVSKALTLEILTLIGLPVAAGPTTQLSNTNSTEVGNKVMVMILYICCLIQQIAGKNKYIKYYLRKLDKIKSDQTEHNFNLIFEMNSWKQKVMTFLVKVHYKAAVWIGYGLNIYLPLFQGITFMRFLLLVCIVATFIIHINTMRVATNKGRIYLNKTYFMWRVFLVLKVVNVSMLIVGIFGFNKLFRTELGIVKDSGDYLAINYMGIESIDPVIIDGISTLQNCSGHNNLYANRLRFYFVIECLTFMFVKFAMKIILIQKIYHDNLSEDFFEPQRLLALKRQKPKLYHVFKMYHKYIMGATFMKSKSGNKIFSNIASFLARIYTSLIYVVTLSISIFTNVSLLMFVSLYFFLNYFIRMNKIFLSYLTDSKVEQVLDISKLS